MVSHGATSLVQNGIWLCGADWPSTPCRIGRYLLLLAVLSPQRDPKMRGGAGWFPSRIPSLAAMGETQFQSFEPTIITWLFNQLKASLPRCPCNSPQQPGPRVRGLCANVALHLMLCDPSSLLDLSEPPFLTCKWDDAVCPEDL